MMMWINIGIALLCFSTTLLGNSFAVSFTYAGFGMGYLGLAMMYR